MQEDEKLLISWWEQYAEQFFGGFTSEGDAHRIMLLNPTLLAILHPISGKRILDIGCGEGYLARMLASKGAIVTGVEYSEAALRLARMRTDPGTVNYYRANCEQMPFISGELFDSIISVLMFDCVANIQVALNEVWRVLSTNGQFILALPHPCFITPDHGWYREGAGEKTHWAVDKYFHEGIIKTDIPGCEEKLVSVHRTLSTYWEQIKKAKFYVNELYEPQPDTALLTKYPSFKEDFRMSQFLVLDLRKC